MYNLVPNLLFSSTTTEDFYMDINISEFVAAKEYIDSCTSYSVLELPVPAKKNNLELSSSMCFNWMHSRLNSCCSSTVLAKQRGKEP